MRKLGIVIAIVLGAFAGAYLVVEWRVPVPTITALTLILVVTFVSCMISFALRAATLTRKCLWVAMLIVGLLPVLLFTGAVSSHIVNDWRLTRFADQILANPPEAAAVRLESARVGVLTGNGNHCDFILDVEVIGALDEHEIREHYETLPIRRAIAGESSQVILRVMRRNADQFMLTIMDAPNNSALDLRCT